MKKKSISNRLGNVKEL